MSHRPAPRGKREARRPPRQKKMNANEPTPADQVAPRLGDIEGSFIDHFAPSVRCLHNGPSELPAGADRERDLAAVEAWSDS